MNTTLLPLVLAGLVTGLLVPLQLAFNAQLAKETASPLFAALAIFVIGTVAMAGVIAVLRPSLPTLASLNDVPATAWLGGIIATAYIVAVVYVTPSLGVGVTVALILLGQLIGSTILDALGAFGNPKVNIDGWRIVGLLLMVAGVLAIKAKDIGQGWS